MERKKYRWCAVPQCTNTSKITPNKIFIDVPRKADIRKKWLNLARRKCDGMSVTSPIYFCEDHFDLPNDMENYMRYHIMGTVDRVMLKHGCLPTKFQCQSDRKRSLPSTVTSRPAAIKRQRLAQVVQEAPEDSTLKSDAKEPNTTLSPSSPPKNNVKNEAVSPQNTPIKEEKVEESNSPDINNVLRNRSVRLKNRKAYLLNRKCSVPLCNSRPSNEISLHPCPNNAAVRNEWAEALRVSYQYVKNMVACSLHFTKLNFIQSSNSERILKHNAVPSRNLPIRKKVVVPGKNKLLRKDGSSNAFERQQKMTGTTGETKEELIPEEFIRECRACLKKLDCKKSCCNVFQAWAPPWDGMEATIAEDLAKLANVEISPQDRHSKVLCAPCYQMLLDAATFAASVRNCDLLLRMRFTADIDMAKVWPKPIQVDKNINGSVFNNPMDIEIKQEVVSDEEYPVNGTDNPYGETELSSLDIKIEPEELVEPAPMNITINGTISLDPLNSENKDIKKGAEVIQEPNCIVMEIKQEPTSEGEQEIEQTPDLSLECLLCTKSFNSVTGLKAHVIAQHSYKTVKRKADGSVSPEKKRCDLHQCAICKRSFQTPTDLMVHETCHNKLACYGCTEKFDSFELLTRHRKRCKASVGNAVQKLKTLDDVKRPLPEEKVEFLELEIEREEPETTDNEKQDIEMKELETIKHEDVEMKDLDTEQKDENQDIQENKAESVNVNTENDKTLECGNEEVQNDIKLKSSDEANGDKKPIEEFDNDKRLESVIEDVDNDKRLESVIEDVDNDKRLESVIEDVDNDKRLESVIEDVDNDKKLESVIEDVDNDKRLESIIDNVDNDKRLESIIDIVDNDKRLESVIEDVNNEKSENIIPEINNVMTQETVGEVVDNDTQLQSVIQEKEEDNDMQLECLVEKVDGDEKLACVIEEVDSVINEESSVDNLESIIKADSDNKTASEKEELIAELSEIESEVKELEDDPDNNMTFNLEIHSTKSETEPQLCDADMSVETLDNDNDDCI